MTEIEYMAHIVDRELKREATGYGPTEQEAREDAHRQLPDGYVVGIFIADGYYNEWVQIRGRRSSRSAGGLRDRVTRIGCGASCATRLIEEETT